MNRLKNCYILLLTLALAACSSDSDTPTPKPEPSGVGNKTYIAVNIHYDTQSPYARGVDAGFEDDDNSTKEGTISELNFYFYDESGNYVTEGSATTPAFTQEEEGTNNNSIESEIKAVVVLKGLSQKDYPKYMVVVANKPSECNLTGKAIADLQTEVINFSSFSKENNFPMVSATYPNGSGSYAPTAASCWFAVPITSTNFVQDDGSGTDPSSAQSVDCYIERIPAKVKLSYANDITGGVQNASVTVGPETLTGTAFPLTLTVDGVESKSDTDPKYYAVISNWGLNATAKQSYVAKLIDDTWSMSWWKDATNNHRCYWGKSTVYGITDASAYLDQTSAGAGTSSDNAKLNYAKYSALSTALGSPDYCFENTNTAAVLQGGNRTYITDRCTSILVKATLAEKEGEAYKPLTLYVYLGKNYTEAEWKKAAVSGLPYYKVKTGGTGSGETTATQIEYDDLKLTSLGAGKVKPEINETASGYTWYKSSEIADANKVEVSEINSYLATYRTADVYTSGQMYYCIPIEHLNSDGDAARKYTYNGYTCQEGDYGVVRNHYYDVTITSVLNIGHAVYDPDEVIVPSDDDKKTYKVGANIKVLAWKHITQQATL